MWPRRISTLRRLRRWLRVMESRELTSPQILHHRQCFQFSLLHALNNLFQGEASFTRSELNGIARSLWRAENESQGFASFWSCLFNSHYNIITGNYDRDVLLCALERKTAVGLLCDPNSGATRTDLRNPMLVGFILHHPMLVETPEEGHWTALRKINNVWYDLDSYLAEPERVGETDEDVCNLLDRCFAGGVSVTRVLRM